MEWVGTASESGTYHLLTENETRSLCGNVDSTSWFGGTIHEVMPRATAEDRGLTLCETCRRASEQHASGHRSTKRESP